MINACHGSLLCSRLQPMFVRAKPITIAQWSRSFAKGKKGTNPKKYRNPLITPTYPRGKKRSRPNYEERVDNDANTDLSRNQKIAIFVFWALIAVGCVILIPHHGQEPAYFPDWTPHPPREGMSIETLTKNHKRWTRKWRQSAEYKDIVACFEVVFENDSVDITTCVRLCLETLSGRIWTTAFDTCDAAMSQLVIFESMVELLRGSITFMSRRSGSATKQRCNRHKI